ncbi:2-oxoisovalerate dehydrogenase E1 component alpha subunit [Deinobacterium chartae]|uniref:2-oxoisovalerate dehydrogenase subunit alpha n=1 Tax=Deinobacterium chartae TaxID=521158 RepID=A0A841I3J3_9DEIO|nr:thiamine pyrophosphate-dependent dehydrogenase E1 component subunit alpha [Deinobacterium chartae]MBB6098899.1 2-oxoisovalerate dehydrogenase E1 component alpha subunit [Deinobacterium chartae]
MFKPFTDQPIVRIGEDGKKIGRWSLDLEAAQLLRLWRDMVRARIFDEKLVTLLRQGKTSFYAQSSGMEATQVGIAHGIRAGYDWVWPYYRDQGLALAAGFPLKDLVAQSLGTNDDLCKGRQMPHHFGSAEHRFVSISSSIANQVAPATGTAMAQKYLGSDEITVCTFGDGATSEGDWHAGLNMAGVAKAPVLFVCENNQWAISAGIATQTASQGIAIKAKAYGMPGYFVDGQDVLAVREVIREVAERVRSGEGPALVECLTYRIGTHSSADDDSRYRSREEVELWRGRDPIRRFERFLEAEGLLPDAETLSGIRAEINAEIDGVLAEAENNGYPTWDSMFDDVYADLPPHLEEQREFLRREQEAL